MRCGLKAKSMLSEALLKLNLNMCIFCKIKYAEILQNWDLNLNVILTSL